MLGSLPKTILSNPDDGPQTPSVVVDPGSGYEFNANLNQPDQYF